MAVGDLKITLPSGTSLELPCADIIRENSPPLLPQERQQGDVDYRSYNPEQASYWDITKDLSGGCGGFYADLNDGKYGIALNFDPVYMTPGPRRTNIYTAESGGALAADYPGIPDHCQIIDNLTVGTTQFVLTSDARCSLFRLVSGQTAWTLVGGGYSGTLGSSFTGWGGITDGHTTAPKCLVALNNAIAVGFGKVTSSSYYVYSGNSLDHGTDLAWVAANNGAGKTGDDRFMDCAITDTYESATGAPNAVTRANRVIYFVQTTDGGELFFTETLSNATAATAGDIVGDTTNDNANSIVMGEDATLLLGKRGTLWEYTTGADIAQANRKEFAYRSTSESGITGYIPHNFRKPVKLANGYIYWLVGDYNILERNPDTGQYRLFSLRESGPMTPLMQLPITAMCAGQDDELIIGVGTTREADYFLLTQFPAGTKLSANDIIDGTTYLFKGKWRRVSPAAATNGELQGDGNGRYWVWHGAFTSLPYMVTHMWWEPSLQRLFVGNGENDHAGNNSPAIGFFRHTTDDGVNYTNADALQTTPTALNISSTGTAAGGDYLYIGHEKRFRGVYFRMDTGLVNGTANTLTVEYGTGAGTWGTAAILADQTDAGGSMGRGGLVYWTMPSDWVENTPHGAGGAAQGSKYWVRLTVDVAFDASTQIAEAHIAHNALPNYIMEEGNPMMHLGTGTIKQSLEQLSDGTIAAGLETGLYRQNTPNIPKVARRMETRLAGIGTDGLTDNGPTFLVATRVAEDDVTGTGYTTLGTYTTNATAKTGTAFPASTVFYGIRARLVFVCATVAAIDPAQLYSCQLVFLNASPVKKRLTAVLNVSNGIISKDGVKLSVSLKQVQQFVDEWVQGGLDPVATVVDTALNDSLSMRLAYGSPRMTGTDTKRQLLLSMVEVV